MDWKHLQEESRDDMEKCSIHMITGKTVGGFISGSQVDPNAKDDLFYDFLDPYLLPVESDGKWGLMNVKTSELAIPLQFDYTGPLVHGASHAVKNGLHGYINAQGVTVLPFQYEDACDEPSSDGYFAVKCGKWGVVNRDNESMIPLAYDRIFLDCCFDQNARWFQPYAGISALQDGRLVLFDSRCSMLADKLTTFPLGYGDYLLLQRGRKFGVACRDGRAITDVTLLRREAMSLIQRLEGVC
jgi:hypothetical protein